MKRHISLALSATLVSLALPRPVEAHDQAPQEVDLKNSTNPMTTSLVYSGTIELGNDWVQTYSIYADSATDDVWGNGYVHDRASVDSFGSADRWLSYTHYNGDFDFLGSDDGRPLRASFGPDEVSWSWTEQTGWVADVAQPTSGPQPLWPLVALVVAVAVALSGDSGCSCGHNGGTENHPGTNHP